MFHWLIVVLSPLQGLAAVIRVKDKPWNLLTKYLWQEDDETQEFGFRSNLLWECALVTHTLHLPSVEGSVSKRCDGDYSFFTAVQWGEKHMWRITDLAFLLSFVAGVAEVTASVSFNLRGSPTEILQIWDRTDTKSDRI